MITALIVSCSDDDTPVGGQTTSIFSSFSTSVGPDSEGLNDGTFVTVTPLAVGVDSYTVDFGDGSSPVTIPEPGGSASYDYPNVVETADYLITVTTIASGQESITKTGNITVTHSPEAVGSVPASPAGNDADVFSIFSDGMDFDGGLLSWENGLDLADVDATVVDVDGNNVIQVSRLGAEAGLVELDEEVIVGEAFAAPSNDALEGIGATDIHFDVYSDFAEGVDEVKVTLIDGDTGAEYTVDNLALTDGEWTSFDFNLASDFGSVNRIDDIRFELGTGGTANDHATIHVDNIYLSKAAGATILNGGFDQSTAQWRFATFTDGTTTPFGSSSDGSFTAIDGSTDGAKTRGAKWTASQSGGPLLSSSSRYAYQALTLTPNTDYILQYEYAIDDDGDNDPIGGRRIVAVVLGDHYIDGADAVADIDSNIGNHFGTIAEGKFSATRGTLVEIPFTTDDEGLASVMFYAVTVDDGWIDNVKVFEN